MFRTIRSTLTRRFATLTFRFASFTLRFAAPAIAAALVLSLAAIGCGSSSDTPPTPTVCDLAGVEALFGLKNCTLGGCHDSSGSSAGLNLTADGLPGRLLGQSPKANMGLVFSSCAGMGKVYLNPGSNPATGLLLDKLTPSFGGCGMRMPSGGSPLTDSQMECVRSWALTLTSP